MEQEAPDETRWLARILAVVFCLLGIRGVFVLYGRLLADNTLLSPGEQLFEFAMICIGLGVSIFLFWLAHRLWTSASIWRAFDWLLKVFPWLLFFQHRYSNINKRCRCGIVTGIAAIIVIAPLPLVVGRYHVVRYILMFFYWPIMVFLRTLNYSDYRNLLFSFLIMVYTFIVGFVVGWCVSCVKGWFAD